MCRYGFNPGSALEISTARGLELATRSAVTTSLAAGSAGVVSVLWIKFRTGVYDLMAICNGVLSGLVSITSSCACVEPWAALIIGALGAILFNVAEGGIQRLQVDDPLSASAMHGCVGMFGALVVGFFAKPDYLLQQLDKSVGDFRSEHTPKGILYGGNGRLLGCQIVGAPPVGRRHFKHSFHHWNV
jgi:ammonium transporter, Amt family